MRPHGPGVTFIQLDDLNADLLAALAPAVFLTLETSPGNFQAWVAMPGGEDKDFARRLRKGTGADATASGATRVAGSLNFKDKYAPDFPRVAIRAAHPGRRTPRPSLNGLALVAAPEVVAQPLRIAPARFTAATAVAELRPLRGRRAAQQRRNRPRLSRADFVWCMTAITWGWTVDRTAERLMEESTKAAKTAKAMPNSPRAMPR